MRHVKMALGLATTMCALAIAAVPAMAEAGHFEATKLGKTPISEETPGKTKGEGVGVQTFKFGGLHIECNKAKAKGTVTQEEFNDFVTEVVYSECFLEDKFGPKEIGHLKTRFNGGKPVTYVYHHNGFVEVGTEVEEEEEGNVKISGGESTFAVSGLKCTITWPAQTIPVKAIKKPEEEYSSATYSNTEVSQTNLKLFPTGFQKRMLITNNFKKLEYSVSNGVCEEFEKQEGKTGAAAGQIEEQVIGGNLSFEPGPVA